MKNAYTVCNVMDPKRDNLLLLLMFLNSNKYETSSKTTSNSTNIRPENEKLLNLVDRGIRYTYDMFNDKDISCCLNELLTYQESIFSSLCNFQNGHCAYTLTLDNLLFKDADENPQNSNRNSSGFSHLYLCKRMKHCKTYRIWDIDFLDPTFNQLDQSLLCKEINLVNLSLKEIKRNSLLRIKHPSIKMTIHLKDNIKSYSKAEDIQNIDILISFKVHVIENFENSTLYTTGCLQKLNDLVLQVNNGMFKVIPTYYQSGYEFLNTWNGIGIDSLPKSVFEYLYPSSSSSKQKHINHEDFNKKISCMLNNIKNPSTKLFYNIITEFTSRYRFPSIGMSKHSPNNLESAECFSELEKNRNTIVIKDLKTRLFNFQAETLLWCLDKENVSFNFETNAVTNRPFFDLKLFRKLKNKQLKTRKEDNFLYNYNYLAKKLDKIVFGWVRLTTNFSYVNETITKENSNPFMFFEKLMPSEVFWYNKFTGGMISTNTLLKELKAKYTMALQDLTSSSAKFKTKYSQDIYCKSAYFAQNLLSEEMGLGKTVELVSLILTNQRKDFQQIEVSKNVNASFIADENFIFHENLDKHVLKAKTTLIVCPDSILNQWIREISKFAPHLKILKYNGFSNFQNEVSKKQKKRKINRTKKFIVTLKFDPDKSEKLSRNFSKRSEILLNFSTFKDVGGESSTKFSSIIDFDNSNKLEILKFKNIPNVSVNNITIGAENFTVPVISGVNADNSKYNIEDSFDLISDNYNRMFNKSSELRISEAQKKVAFELSQYDIVVTSYRVAAKEFYHAKYSAPNRPERLSRKRKFRFIEQKEPEELLDYTSPLTLLQYWRVILDEVQMATMSNAAKTCKMFARCHAWGISGTPIKRELSDIMSHITFLNLSPFAEEGDIEKTNVSSIVNRHPKNYSWNAILNQHISIDFLKILTNLAIRHDKSLVKNDINLPKQRRILLTSTFSPIEQDNYKIIFEKFLYESGLNTKGEPVVNDWTPNIALMRKYLMILRKTCSYIGLPNDLSNNTSAISSTSIDKTKETYSTVSMDDILDRFLNEARNIINDLDKDFVNLYIELAEIEELLHNPCAFKNKLLEKVGFVISKIEFYKKEIIFNKMKKSKVTRLQNDIQAECEKTDLSQIELSGDYETDEALLILKTRLKSWLELLHKIYFFIANSNYQISLKLLAKLKVKPSILESEVNSQFNSVRVLSDIHEISVNDLEDVTNSDEIRLQLYYDIKLLELKYYRMAEDIRCGMLKSFSRKFHETVSSFCLDYPQKCKTFTTVNLEEFQQRSFGSIRTKEIKMWYFKLFKVFEEFEYITKISNEWLDSVTKILLSNISNTSNKDASTYSTTVSSETEEYERSIIDQEKAFYILCILEIAFKFHEAILFGLNSSFLNSSGILSSKSFNELTINAILEKPMYDNEEADIDVKLKNQKKGKKVRRKNNEDSEESIELKLFKSDLKRKIQKIKPMICQEGGDNLEYNITSLFEQSKLFHFLNVEDTEKMTFQKTVNRLVKLKQDKSSEYLDLSKKYYHSLNLLYNARSSYYKQLQNISDGVKSTDFNKYTNLVNRNLFTQYEVESFEGLAFNKKLLFLAFVKENIIAKALQENRTKAAKFNSRCLYLDSLKDYKKDDKDIDERICIICQCPIIAGVLTECGHHYCKECLYTWMSKTRHHHCPLCKSKVTKNSVYEFTFIKQNLEVGIITDSTIKEKSKDDEPDDRYIFYSKLDDNEFTKINKQETRFKNKYGAKIESLLKLVLWLKSNDDNVQIVIFSQWPDFLAIVACSLRENGINTIGGETKVNRIGSDEINKFRYDSSITCFLLNAQQQAAGLTLVNATNVVLCEPLVNTALELQAINRVHRIGQRFETTIWMLGIQGTIEESIINLCTAKRIEQLTSIKHSDSSDIMSSHLTEFSESSTGESEDQMENNQLVIDSMDLMKETGKLVNAKEGELVPTDELWKSFFTGVK